MLEGELRLWRRAHVSERVSIRLKDNITVRVANVWIRRHVDKAIRAHLLTGKLEGNVVGLTEIHPEARAESWHRVEIVEAVFELILTAFVEGRVSNVDGALSVEVSGAHVVDLSLRTHANVVDNVLGVARVLIRVVGVQHVVSVTVDSEWLV